MAIDLKNLIDQVLGMARESLDLRKRNAEASWYGGNKDEEEYWKEMRRRNTELELRGAEGKNRLAEREMINSGDLEKQRVADAGALARQGLANEGTRYTADQNLQGHVYTADTNYAMKRDELNKGYDPELIKAHAAIIANVNSTPEAVASSQAAIDWYTQKTKNKGSQARQGLAEEAPAAIPASTPPAAVPAAGAIKAPDYRASDIYTPGVPASSSVSMVSGGKIPGQPPTAETPSLPQISINTGATDDAAIADYRKKKKVQELRSQLSPEQQKKELDTNAGYMSRLPGAVPSYARKREQEIQINENKKRQGWLDSLTR